MPFFPSHRRCDSGLLSERPSRQRSACGEGGWLAATWKFTTRSLWRQGLRWKRQPFSSQLVCLQIRCVGPYRQHVSNRPTRSCARLLHDSFFDVPSRNPFLNRRGRFFRYCMRPVPVVFLRMALVLQLYLRILALGNPHDAHVFFWMWKLRFPHLRQRVWDLLCLFPVVPIRPIDAFSSAFSSRSIRPLSISRILHFSSASIVPTRASHASFVRRPSQTLLRRALPFPFAILPSPRSSADLSRPPRRSPSPPRTEGSSSLSDLSHRACACAWRRSPAMRMRFVVHRWTPPIGPPPPPPSDG